MAKETVKARNLRLMTEANAREEATKQAYPKFLMETLSRLTTYAHVYELRVQNELFVVQEVEWSYRQKSFKMSYNYSNNSQEDLTELSEALNRLEEERLEEERKANVKEAAQRKLQEFLSAEERELLGL